MIFFNSLSVMKILVYSFILTLFGGTYMFGFHFFGIHIYAFRIVLVLGGIYFFFTKNLFLFESKFIKKVFYFLLLWLTYAIISLIWAPDIHLGIHDIVYIFIGIMIFLFTYKIFNSNRIISNFYYSWVFSLIFCTIFSFWEIETAKHFISSFSNELKELSEAYQNHYMPIFTFDNPNHFAIYLCLSICILMYFNFKRINIFLNTLLIVSSVFLLFQIETRLGVVFIYFSFFIYLIFEFLRCKKSYLLNNSIGFLVVILIMSISLLNHKFVGIKLLNEIPKSSVVISDTSTNTNSTNFNSASSKVSSITNTSEVVFDSSSISIRKNLMLNGLNYFKSSFLMGVGAGGFQSNVMKGNVKFPVLGISNPHSYFIEVLSQYGLIITLLYVSIFFYISYFVIKKIISKKIKGEYYFVLLLIVCFVIMSNANSSFLSLPINWFMFSLIIIFSNRLLNNENKC